VADDSGTGVAAGTDFSITRRDGVTFQIDLDGAETIGDVLQRINTNPDNLAAGTPLVARLAAYGNGIELVDNSAGSGTLTVTRGELSAAAIDLGLIPPGQESRTASAGQPDLLTGSDVNSQETEGLFTVLLRLQDGLLTNDAWETQRSIEMLDSQVLELNFSRAELGARQQGLDTLKDRLDSEDVELQASLSQEYDADLAETISNLTGRQTAFEASLRSIAQIFQMSLLNYL
jgi:flagellin-like hook-associated protein FlgL